MSQGQRSTLLAYLRRLVGTAATDGSDAELLERFARQREEAAFEALLRRHGPLVWSVCRRVLAQEHAAEDAFQATFLVLVRKARSVSKQASIRSWLHGVALRVALRARQQEQLRRRREQETPSRSPGEATWQDVRPILDEEIQRLPEKYRLPVILCYLEGQTNDEAARLLNCPRGTIATRLARARERLRFRLLRRGVTLSAGALMAMLTDNLMSAVVPPLLLAQTTKAVLMGTASVSIIALTEGVIHAMFLSKVKTATVFALVLAGVAGTGAGAYYLRAQASPSQVAPPKPAEVPAIQGIGQDEQAEKLRKDWEELSKQLADVAPDNEAAGKPEERFRKLLQVRREMAVLERSIRYEYYRAGWNEPGTSNPVTLHLAIDATKHLLKSDLELSKNKEERVAAREEYLKVIKEIVKISAAQYKVGRILRSALSSALYEQLDAEVELEREKTR
ncbi:MAG TPA: sigma-70 family RNA polymerase sigma factor [Gemmataceae bacterium]|jgi:RNA polymerase sigma factor (sigma-70 family)